MPYALLGRNTSIQGDTTVRIHRIIQINISISNDWPKSAILFAVQFPMWIIVSACSSSDSNHTGDAYVPYICISFTNVWQSGNSHLAQIHIRIFFTKKKINEKNVSARHVLLIIIIRFDKTSQCGNANKSMWASRVQLEQYFIFPGVRCLLSRATLSSHVRVCVHQLNIWSEANVLKFFFLNDDDSKQMLFLSAADLCALFLYLSLEIVYCICKICCLNISYRSFELITANKWNRPKTHHQFEYNKFVKRERIKWK